MMKFAGFNYCFLTLAPLQPQLKPRVAHNMKAAKENELRFSTVLLISQPWWIRRWNATLPLIAALRTPRWIIVLVLVRCAASNWFWCADFQHLQQRTAAGVFVVMIYLRGRITTELVIQRSAVHWLFGPLMAIPADRAGQPVELNSFTSKDLQFGFRLLAILNPLLCGLAVIEVSSSVFLYRIIIHLYPGCKKSLFLYSMKIKERKLG